MSQKGLLISVLVFFALAASVVVVSSIISKMPNDKGNLDSVLSPVISDDPLKPVPFEYEKKDEATYSIDLEYPKSDKDHLPEIANYVSLVKDQFTQSLPTGEVTENYLLKINTTVYTASSTISYKLETYMYTGGAHGGTFIETFTYGKDGKLITLNDLLVSADSMKKLSTSARAYLYNKIGDQSQKEVIDAGTEPTLENFGVWYITDAGIVFVFQQYQVGPYTLGIQEFPIRRLEAEAFLNI
jgi:hypothetical protein